MFEAEETSQVPAVTFLDKPQTSTSVEQIQTPGNVMEKPENQRQDGQNIPKLSTVVDPFLLPHQLMITPHLKRKSSLGQTTTLLLLQIISILVTLTMNPLVTTESTLPEEALMTPVQTSYVDVSDPTSGTSMDVPVVRERTEHLSGSSRAHYFAEAVAAVP